MMIVLCFMFFPFTRIRALEENLATLLTWSVVCVRGLGADAIFLPKKANRGQKRKERPLLSQMRGQTTSYIWIYTKVLLKYFGTRKKLFITEVIKE